jgi:hypothetical protein
MSPLPALEYSCFYAAGLLLYGQGAQKGTLPTLFTLEVLVTRIFFRGSTRH